MTVRQLLVLLLTTTMVCFGAASCRSFRPSGKPNILLITVDTLRADHLSCYGYPRRTSPAADALAARGVLFVNAMAQIPETLPSIVSIMTAMYPIDHGVRENGRDLGPQAALLAEILRGNGYRTAGFVSCSLLSARRGIDRGFQHYDETVPDRFLLWPRGQRTAEKTTDAAIAWIDQNAGREPFFLWLHFIDPHSLYSPPPPFDDEFRNEPYSGIVDSSAKQFFRIIRGELRIDSKDRQYLVDRYDGEIAFMESNVSRVLAALERQNLGDTLIVYTADHGESLGEHDYLFDHGDFLYDDQIRVPLIFSHPRLEQSLRVEHQVETVDIMPTILDFFGLAPRPEWRGRSLLALLEGRPDTRPPSFSFSESSPCWEGGVRRCAPIGIEGKIYSLRSNQWKLVFDPTSGQSELFRLADDPAELTNRVTEEPLVAELMRRHLTGLLEGMPVRDQPPLSEETLEEL
ncbi:MAG: sulfatase, partial [Acidobacteriota bacterium]